MRNTYSLTDQQYKRAQQRAFRIINRTINAERNKNIKPIKPDVEKTIITKLNLDRSVTGKSNFNFLMEGAVSLFLAYAKDRRAVSYRAKLKTFRARARELDQLEERLIEETIDSILFSAAPELAELLRNLPATVKHAIKSNSATFKANLEKEYRR